MSETCSAQSYYKLTRGLGAVRIVEVCPSEVKGRALNCNYFILSSGGMAFESREQLIRHYHRLIKNSKKPDFKKEVLLSAVESLTGSLLFLFEGAKSTFFGIAGIFLTPFLLIMKAHRYHLSRKIEKMILSLPEEEIEKALR